MTDKSNEVNIRWQQSHNNMKKLTGLLAACAVVLWPISYNASFVSATTGQGMWFAAVSVAALIVAGATTIGATVAFGATITDNPPLPGSNY